MKHKIKLHSFPGDVPQRVIEDMLEGKHADRKVSKALRRFMKERTVKVNRQRNRRIIDEYVDQI